MTVFTALILTWKQPYTVYLRAGKVLQLLMFLLKNPSALLGATADEGDAGSKQEAKAVTLLDEWTQEGLLADHKE